MVMIGVTFIGCALLLLSGASAHSQMSNPESTAPKTCREGGESSVGVMECAGPCDLRSIRLGYVNHASPSNPAATYRRGQKVEVKYQRNNHGPGGFHRVTIVPVKDMMNKAVHKRNAFHWSCWGAHPRRATSRDVKRDRYGYSIAGNDGDEHNMGKGYYSTWVTIPTVIPDGDYLFGWVWYGGTGSRVTSNRVQRPSRYGYFSDYWSCAYIRIRGGTTTRTWRPMFENDMQKFSSAGCMAANDRPGVCRREPCNVIGKYQKPAEFKNGKHPGLLTAAHFGGKASGQAYSQQRNRPNRRKSTGGKLNKNMKSGNGNGQKTYVFPSGQQACRCIDAGTKCQWPVANGAKSDCKARTAWWRQPYNCQNSCCYFCKKYGRHTGVCKSNDVRNTCSRFN